jgi:hypothetical protein
MDSDRFVPDFEWATMFFLERMELGVSELLGCAYGWSQRRGTMTMSMSMSISKLILKIKAQGRK